MADLPVGKDRRVGRLGGVESFDVVGVYAISETQLLSDMICNRMASRMQTATAVNTLQLKLAINRKEKKKAFYRRPEGCNCNCSAIGMDELAKSRGSELRWNALGHAYSCCWRRIRQFQTTGSN